MGKRAQKIRKKAKKRAATAVKKLEDDTQLSTVTYLLSSAALSYWTDSDLLSPKGGLNPLAFVLLFSLAFRELASAGRDAHALLIQRKNDERANWQILPSALVHLASAMGYAMAGLDNVGLATPTGLPAANILAISKALGAFTLAVGDAAQYRCGIKIEKPTKPILKSITDAGLDACVSFNAFVGSGAFGLMSPNKSAVAASAAVGLVTGFFSGACFRSGEEPTNASSDNMRRSFVGSEATRSGSRTRSVGDGSDSLYHAFRQ
jgi:hypothetical protein